MDLGDVSDRDRHAVTLVDDDRGDVGDAVNLALAADISRLAIVDKISAADVGVIHPKRFEDRHHRKLVSAELIGIKLDLIRLEFAAVRVDFGNSRHLAKLKRDEPITDRAEFHRRDARRLVGLHLELKHLAKRRGDWPERRRSITRRNCLRGARETFTDKLARPVDVGPFVKHDGHHRDPELRDRTNLLDVRQAAHRPLDREREQGLDLHRAQRGGFGDDLNLNVGQVGNGVDRQPKRRVNSQAGHEKRAGDHEKSIIKRAGNQSVEHEINER